MVDGRAVAEDRDGNVIVTGIFMESADFGDQTLTAAGDMDIVVLKLDAMGKTVFSKRFGGAAGNDVGSDVAVDETGAIFTTGWFHGTVDFGAGPYTTPDLGWYLLKLAP